MMTTQSANVCSLESESVALNDTELREPRLFSSPLPPDWRFLQVGLIIQHKAQCVTQARSDIIAAEYFVIAAQYLFVSWFTGEY